MLTLRHRVILHLGTIALQANQGLAGRILPVPNRFRDHFLRETMALEQVLDSLIAGFHVSLSVAEHVFRVRHMPRVDGSAIPRWSSFGEHERLVERLCVDASWAAADLRET